jgi:hypothetical protein
VAASGPAGAGSKPGNLGGRHLGRGVGALAAARVTGHPVVVPGLTTPTTTVTVSPDGMWTLTDHVLPVRVRQHGRWVPVNTTLRRGGHGMLVPTAIPGDAVAFSGGVPGRPR